MNSTVRHFSKIEFILLCLFAVALPLVEAPKNVFLALFVLVWLGRSIWQRNVGGQVNHRDAVFAALLLAASVASIASPLFRPDWKEYGDIVSYLLLGWTCCRTRLSSRQCLILIACLIGATLLGIAQGLWAMQTDTKRIALQLNSVGQTNHSALYVVGIFGVALALVIPRFHKLGMRLRVAGMTLLLSLLASIMVFGSRGALIACLLTLAVFMWQHQKRHALPLRKVLLLGLCVMAAGLYLKRDMIEKTRINLSAEGSITALRGETARSAVETWRQSPLWGVGPGNLPEVTREQIEAWVTARGATFDPSRYTWRLHAHNVYFNTLAERGLLGLSALLALAALWARQLLRQRPLAQSEAMHWTAWGAGLSGFVLVFVGGLFNTTLHHEHGMLAMLCLALLLHTGSESER